MLNVTLFRPSRSDLPVAVRYPACNDACAAAVVSLVSQPVYTPRPADPSAGLYDVFEGRGRHGRRFTYQQGGYRAVLRPARTRVGPAEVSGSCHVCGGAVTANRSLPTSFQTVGTTADDSWESPE